MNENYVKFTLWALAYGRDQRERMQTLLRWAVIQTGRDAVEKFEIENPGRLEKLEEPDGPWSYEDGQAWALGCEILRANNKKILTKECLESHAKLERFMAVMDERCGRRGDKRCSVMLPLEWFWRAYFPACGWKHNGPLTWDLFAVLCAIKSKVGDDPKKPKNERGMAFVTWPEIQCRSLGYLTETDMERCLPLREDGVKPFSRDVIRARARRIRAGDMMMSYTPRVRGKNGKEAWKPVAYGYGVSDTQLIAWADAQMGKRAGGYKGKLRAKQEAQAELSRRMQSK
jgi:hypothetical protein